MGTELAKTEQKPVVKVGTRGVQFTTLDEMYRFAEAVSQSPFAPKDNRTPQGIMIAMQMGMEVGLGAMQAIQNIAVINGRPSLWGDAVLGVCRGSGVFDEATFEELIEGTGDDMVAVCRVRRLPDGKVREERFSVCDAKRAKLWSKDGTWQTYPKRMLQMRARAFALRDTFGDSLRGIGVVEEELDKVPFVNSPSNTPRISSSPLNETLGTTTEPGPAEPEPESEPAPDDNPNAEIERASRAEEYHAALRDCEQVQCVRELYTDAETDETLLEQQRLEIMIACEKRAAEIKAKESE